MVQSALFIRKYENEEEICFPRTLSGSLSKSGRLDFGTKNNFSSFFVSEKGLVHIYKKAIYYFPVSYFCFATSQN